MTEPASEVQVSPTPELLSGEPYADALRSRLTASEQSVRELKEALRSAGDRERLLAYELQHRVRNMLAVIRSIYRRTRESGASTEEFANHFEGRLNAVARHHTATAGSVGRGFDLEDVIREELLAVHCMDGPHLTIAGPPACLQEKPAELIGLVIHELTTNAIKFGALCKDGRLTIEWSIVDVPAPETLHFRWREEGVSPLTKAPRPKGFGRQLIEDALPYELGATTSFELKPGGVDCVIILPAAVKDQPRQSEDPQFDDDEAPSNPRPTREDGSAANVVSIRD